MSSSQCGHGCPRSLSAMKKLRYEKAIKLFRELLSTTRAKAGDCLEIIIRNTLRFLFERRYLGKEFLAYLVSKGVTKTQDFYDGSELDDKHVVTLVSSLEEVALVYLAYPLEYILNLQSSGVMWKDSVDGRAIWKKLRSLVFYPDVVRFYAKRCPCACLVGGKKRAKTAGKLVVCQNEECCGVFPRDISLTCGSCSIPIYCSAHCQKKDWKARHKDSCASDTEKERALNEGLKDRKDKDKKGGRAFSTESKRAASRKVDNDDDDVASTIVVGKAAGKGDKQQEDCVISTTESTKSTSRNGSKMKRMSNKKKKQQRRKNKHKK